MSSPFLNIEYFFNQLYRLIAGAPEVDLGVPDVLYTFLFYARAVLLLLIPVFAVVVGVLMYKISRLRRDEKHEMRMILLNTHTSPVKNERWERVMKLIDSDSESDWKLAVIEGDTILDELVKAMHLPGENLGERLKNVEPSDFDTLQDAWEAHKVRNRVAHESGYRISRRDARVAIERFRRVFEEFNYI